MRSSVIPSIVLSLAVSCAWSAEQELDATKTTQDGVSNQNTRHKKPHMHDDHRHRHPFADPAEMQKKWNNPERDSWQHPNEIVEALELKRGATVADIGAGTGYMVAHLSRAVGKEGTVVAIDSSPQMVEYLADRNAEMGPAKIDPREVGSDDPGLRTATVDAVLTLDTWHHLREREAYAKKVYAGLKSGGRFVVVEHDVDAEIGPPKLMRLGPKQVMKQLAAAGFRVEIVKESMPRHYIVVGFKE